MSYACQNCCPDSFYQALSNDCLDPMFVEDTTQLVASQRDRDCYGQIHDSYGLGGGFSLVGWSSFDAGVASVGAHDGVAYGEGEGSTYLQGSWYADFWTYLPSSNSCQHSYEQVAANALCEIAPRVQMSSAQTITDGSTASFSVTIQRGTAVGYEWTYMAPSNSGNNPHVTFSSSNTASTTTNGHWFANPNQECPNTNCNGVYTIKCKVTFDDGKTETADTTLTVNGCWFPAGQVNPNDARVAGAPTMSPDSNGVWRVTSMGTLRRQLPSKTVFVPSASQFHAKADAHEQEHLNHWNEGNLFGHLFQPADFYARIQNFTGATQQELINKLSAELTLYSNEQGVFYTNNLIESERRAYRVSDPIPPRYLYQNCGRY